MNLVQAYELIYTGEGVPQHVMKQIAGLENLSMSVGSAANIQVAEWMLSKIEYEGKRIIRNLNESGASTQVTKNVAGYVKHIHAVCKDEIESRFARPMLSDEDVGHILWDDVLSGLLDDVAKGDGLSDTDLRSAVKSADSVLRIMTEVNSGSRKKSSEFENRFGMNVADSLRRKW